MAEDIIWDNWEDFADCGDIDKHVENGLKINGTNDKLPAIHKEDLCGTNSSFDAHDIQYAERNSLSPKPGIRILARPVVVHEEDRNRTAYTPQLKILKRPGKSSEQQKYEDDQRRLLMQQPVKTLAQREAAYAEARQRIMGNERNKASNENCTKSAGAISDTRTSSRQEHMRRYSKSKNHQNGKIDVKRHPKGAGNGKGFKSNR